MDARLEYCGNSIEIKDFRHYVEDEANGNPYNCAFNIKVSSGFFSGFADGCECDYKQIKEFVTQLENLVLFKISDVSFVEIGYGNRIDFKADKTGHIIVSGTIRSGDCSQRLEFEFFTEQTVFPPFIESLKAF